MDIFTDGSKTPLGTGAGYVIMIGNKQLLHTQSLNLPNEASIYQAELSAIAHACQWMHNHMEAKYKYIKIFSDSKSSLEALQARTCKSNTVLDTHNDLNTLAEQVHKLSICWIKAHVGLDGNELADEYAKLGTLDDSVQINVHTTKNDVRLAIEEYIFHKWKDKWHSYKGGRQTKIFYPQPCLKMGRKLDSLARIDRAIFIQAITGQNNLNYLNHLIVDSLTPLCRFCEEDDETFHHLLEECPVFLHQRMDIFLDKSPTDTWTPNKIIKFVRIPDIYLAFTTNITENYK